MARHGGKSKNTLKLTSEEAESIGVELAPGRIAPVSEETRTRPLHEQVVGALTEDDVVEALAGEVTAETREDVEESVADQQEEEAERQGL